MSAEAPVPCWPPLSSSIPGSAASLVEQPEVLPDADRLLSKRSVRDRCEFVGGSFFNAIPAAGEVWTLCQVLHDWPDEECRAILGRCRDAMRDTDRLLVIEMLTVPCEPNPGLAMLDMMMLFYFGEARQCTVAEYTKNCSAPHASNLHAFFPPSAPSASSRRDRSSAHRMHVSGQRPDSMPSLELRRAFVQ